MQNRTKHVGKGGRPRKFNEDEVALRLQRQLWTTGLSGVSLDGIARSVGLNRPSLAATFGDKDAIYARAATQYAAMMDDRLGQALGADELHVALQGAFDTAIDIYTGMGPDGCFVICTAPAEAMTSAVCRNVLDQSITAIDALFLRRLQSELVRSQSNHEDLPTLVGMLGSTLHSIALRARAGWSRDRLQRLARGAVDHVTIALYGRDHRCRSPSEA